MGGRHMDRLPEALSFEASDARQDRVLASVKRWTFTGTVDEFGIFGEHLSRAYEEAGNSRKLFNKRGGMFPFAPRWQISGGKQERDFVRLGTPLLGGSLRARLVSGDLAGRRCRWELEADLALNPTRWAMFEPSTLHRTPKSEWFSVPVNLFATATGGPREPSLTGGGNVVAGPQRRQAMAHPSNWRIQLERYVCGALDYLDQRFRAAADHASGLVQRRRDDVTLKTVETYWEIGATDALGFVRRLELPLRAQASKSHVRWWPTDPRSPTVDRTTEIGTDENSPVVRIQLAKGTSLRVYAKLRGRVRLEVIHKARDAGCFGHTKAEEIAALFGWFDLAAIDASERVNRVFRSLEEYLRPARYDHPPHQVAIEILRALRDTGIGEDALHILVREGRLVRSPQSSFGNVIDRLVQRGILQHLEQTGNDHLYVPTARYRHGLELLRNGAALDEPNMEER
jgi:hypothetical protein